MLKKIFILFIVPTMIFALPSCESQKATKKKVQLCLASTHPLEQSMQKSQAPRVTVWLHGSKGLGRISDYIHAIPQQGLVHVSTVPESYRLSKVLKTLCETDPLNYPFEHFFVFGWSGKLSFDVRLAESKKLYTAIATLSQEYENKCGIAPIITLITHSHGGNVALNLALAKEESPPFVIEQLILLACPVQHETENFIQDPLFKSVFSLYSSTDMLQILDPQGMYITEHNPKRHLELSHRQFPAHPKLRQAKLKINGHGVMHVGFVVNSFAKMLPHMIAELRKWDHAEPTCEGETDEQMLLITT